MVYFAEHAFCFCQFDSTETPEWTWPIFCYLPLSLLLTLLSGFSVWSYIFNYIVPVECLIYFWYVDFYELLELFFKYNTSVFIIHKGSIYSWKVFACFPEFSLTSLVAEPPNFSQCHWILVNPSRKVSILNFFMVYLNLHFHIYKLYTNKNTQQWEVKSCKQSN